MILPENFLLILFYLLTGACPPTNDNSVDVPEISLDQTLRLRNLFANLLETLFSSATRQARPQAAA